MLPDGACLPAQVLRHQTAVLQHMLCAANLLRSGCERLRPGLRSAAGVCSGSPGLRCSGTAGLCSGTTSMCRSPAAGLRARCSELLCSRTAELLPAHAVLPDPLLRRRPLRSGPVDL